MAEVERLRSDNAYSTVSDAVQRMEAIVSERDGEIRDLIIEKSGIHSHNFEVIDKKIARHFANLEKRIDRIERAGAAKPPTIHLSESTIRKITRIVLEESTRSPASPVTAHDGEPAPAPAARPDKAELNQPRVVTEAERAALIGELN